ncbi:hypothetical protein [Stenotrophomonas sp.]|uniref:hypothetical protein n=1 Tax=Stenotrophomonas sp. TaxID=69392 RepID=UPI0028AD8489|nr:hypothetical protein [Stenotrophomonas sp.]
MNAIRARSEAAIAAERIACARATKLQRFVDQLQLQAAELAADTDRSRQESKVVQA